MRKQIAKWKDGARVAGVDPGRAAQEFDRIAKSGPLTPARVLEAARKKRNPLHSFFEWDDSVAAEKYRREQARYLIRSLVIVVEDRPEQRKFISLGNGIRDDADSEFHDIEVVASDVTLRDQAIRKAWNRLLAVKQEYHHLVEFMPVWKAIDRVQRDVAG